MHNTPRGIIVLLIAVAVLIVPPIIYSVHYVRNRTVYVNERDVRALDAVGRRFNDALSDFGRIVATYGRQGKQNEFMEFQQQVTLMTLDDTGTCYVPAAKKGPTGVAITYAPHDDQALYFGYAPSEDEVRKSPAAPTAPAAAPLCARAPLAMLLADVGEERFFDGMFLADAEGRVLYQSGASEMRLNRLGSEKTRAAPAKPPAAAPAKPEGGAPPAVDGSDLLRATDITPFPSADRPTYKLFTRPIRVPLPLSMRQSSGASTPAGDKEWILGGFVKQDKFDHETRELPASLVSAVPFLLLLLALAWPALKLWSLDPRERIRSIDVHLLSICTVLAVAWMSLGLVYVYARAQIRARVDDDLVSLSRDLKKNLRHEIGDAHADLRAFVHSVREGHLNTESSDPATTSGEEPQRKKLDSRLLARNASPFDAHPYFNMLMWADASGQQLVKWTTEASYTPPIKIEKFGPFRHTRDDTLDILPMPDGGAELALDVVFSPNTRKALPIVSEPASPFDRFSEAGKREFAYVSIVPHLRSAINAVLPLDYGFAVLDPDGRVLLHSDSMRNTRENFYQECDDDQRLVRPSVEFAHQDRFDVSYHGRAHRMLVTPLPHLRLALVVFHDDTMLGTLESEMLMASVVMLVSCMLLYVAALAVALLLWRQESTTWFWPDANRVARYYRGIAGCVLLALLVGWFVFAERGFAVVAASVLAAATGEALVFLLLAPDDASASRRQLPLAALGTVVALLLVTAGATNHPATFYLTVAVMLALVALIAMESRTRRTPGVDHPRALLWGYCGLWVSVVVLIAVLPSLAIFKDAYGHGMETLVRAGELKRAQELARRGEYVARRYDDVSWKKGRFLVEALAYGRDCYRSRRLLGQRDGFHLGRLERPPAEVPASPLVEAAALPAWPLRSFLAGTCFAHENDEQCRLLTRHVAGFVASFFPSYDETAARVRRLAYESAADRRWATMISPGDAARIPRYITWVPDASSMLSTEARDVRYGYYTRDPKPREESMTMAATVAPLALPAAAPSWLALVVAVAIWLLLAFRLIRWLSNSLFGLEVWYDTAGRTAAAPSPAASTASPAEAQGPPAAAESAPQPGAPASVKKGMRERAVDACLRLWTGDAKVRLDRLLADECESQGLRDIAAKIRARDDATRLTHEQVIEQVGDLAHERYDESWKSFSQAKKLVLIHLAQEGFVNPRGWETVRAAARDGLVRRMPAVRFVSESFRRFVATVETPSTIAAWETSESKPTFLDTRTIVGTLFVAAAAFMVLTQPDVFQGWVGVASGVVGGVPVFTKLFGLMKNRGTDTSEAKS